MKDHIVKRCLERVLLKVGDPEFRGWAEAWIRGEQHAPRFAEQVYASVDPRDGRPEAAAIRFAAKAAMELGMWYSELPSEYRRIEFFVSQAEKACDQM